MSKTLYDKLWDKHLVVDQTDDTPALLFIDLHLIHEVTSPQAFDGIRKKGIALRRPDLTFATMDHSTPTLPPDTNGKFKFFGVQEETQVNKLKENCNTYNIPLFALGDDEQGIVHVISPELGLTLPGKTIVCGDSHTSTHGAFGALAFGIGTSEVMHTFATQCILQRKAKSLGIKISGKLSLGVSAKDVILYIISQIGIGGGTGHVIEYFGETITAMNMEERMTICNMSIEAGARAGIIAPDETTFNYIKGRRFAPKETDFTKSVETWKHLKTDDIRAYDKLLEFDASQIKPMITYGTNPEMGIYIDAKIPINANEKSLTYMDFKAGDLMIGKAINAIFIGSCTNSRISDLREAAAILKNKSVAKNVRALVVAGSKSVKKQAEAEGLDKIFINAGAEWREPGCSMCLGMNGDTIAAGELCISTSNRNFEGRQGKNSRTLLASPITAAASAIAGKIVDPRNYLQGVS